MVKIVADSISDIPPEVAREQGITVVPTYLHFDNIAYRDRVDITPEEFYRRLLISKTLPTTSAPPPGAFAQTFDELAEETDEILTITVSSKLSATYDAALKGKEERKRKGCRVEVIDSLNALMAEGFLAMVAARAARAGARLDEVIDIVKKTIPKARIQIVLDTLEYLKRGGRVTTLQFWLGTLLQFKPVLTIKEGLAQAAARVRTRAKAIQHLEEFVKGIPNIRELAVEYSTTPDEAARLIENLSSVFPKERIYICTMSPVIGTHAGPGALGVAVLEEE